MLKRKPDHLPEPTKSDPNPSPVFVFAVCCDQCETELGEASPPAKLSAQELETWAAQRDAGHIDRCATHPLEF